MAARVNVCLRTDGPSSNNNLNLFEEMKVTALVQKNAYHLPAAFPVEQIWEIATKGAYKAFNLDMDMREGALADLAPIDLRSPWLCPQSNIVSHLVYSMTGEVDTNIVNRQVLMQNGYIHGETKIMEKAQERFERLTA